MKKLIDKDKIYNIMKLLNLKETNIMKTKDKPNYQMGGGNSIFCNIA